MYKYKIENSDGITLTFTKENEIEFELARLKNEPDYFIIVESTPQIENINFIQVANNSHYKGLFKKRLTESYHIEMCVTNSAGTKQIYANPKNNSTFEDTKKIITDYITLQKTPDYLNWGHVLDIADM